MAETVNIDIFPTTEEVSLTIEPNLITINVNTVTSTGAVTSVNGMTGDVIIENSTSIIKQSVKLSEAITKGQAVYVSSANGTNIIVSKASNATEATSSKTLGLIETTGATNAIVNVVTDGLLGSLNTSSATIGDPVWLGTSGNLIFGLSSKPVAPAHLVYLGVVSRVHATNGEILVKVQNGFEVEELHNMSDVSYNSIIDTDSLLIKDVTTSYWKRLTFANLKTWLDSYLTASKIRGYLGISTLSGSNTGDQDLSNLALKTMGAYSFRVNNTNATANATETNFKQIGKTAYSGTITWTGTTAPSGTLNQSYNWIQIGNLVSGNLTLVYATGGTANTAVVLTFPTDLPNPIKPDGLASASHFLYEIVGKFNSSEVAAATGGNDAYIRSNSANNGFEFVVNQVSIGTRVVRISFQYFTA